MNFLKSGLQSVLGAGQEAVQQQQSGGETVERLVDRVISSTLLEDRRDACRALRSLSRKYRIEVGAQGIPALIQVLEQDRADCEIVGYALDTLCNVTSQEQFQEELDNPTVSMKVGEQFTEMLIKDTKNVTLTLSYLEEYDFKVRWPAIRLLTILLTYRPKELQEVVLVSPMGVSKLMDLLSDTREIIRNDALLLLIHLTKGNANIQKIVAFENAFDRLFDIIRDEGASDGGVVVEDCLILMLNLLKNNTSNQQFFKEGSFIQRLAPMFVLPAAMEAAEESSWTGEKVVNVHCMLQVVRTLLSPANSNQIIAAFQDKMRAAGLLEALCNILMASGVPADILTETINAVGEMVRGDATNQDFLSHVMAPSNPPRPAIVVLLMSMVNERQPLPLRCAVLYCFQCYLYRNEPGQSHLIQTLLPASAEVSHLTQGQLLCDGLFSPDALANWFSASALMYGLIENPVQKEQLLRVLLATMLGGEPVSLLHQCSQLLQQDKNVRSQVGLLMLLSTWLSHCPVAVKQFLAASNSVAYLIAQIGANEHDEHELLVQGLCAFLMGICIQFNDNMEAHYRRDDLCQLLVKRISVEVYLRKLSEVSKHESYSRAAKQPQIWMKSNAEVLLDFEFCKLFKAMEAVITKTVIGLERTDDGAAAPPEMSLSNEATAVVAQYKGIIREQDAKMGQLEQRVQQTERELAEARSQLAESQAQRNQLNDQNILLKAQLTAATDLVNQLQLGQQMAGLAVSSDNNNNAGGNSSDNVKVDETAAAAAAANVDALRAQEVENERLRQEVTLLRDNLKVAVDEAAENRCEMEKLRKDQEDLLELLTDQDTKMSGYRRQLRALGAAVEPSDDEDEDDEQNNDDLVAAGFMEAGAQRMDVPLQQQQQQQQQQPQFQFQQQQPQFQFQQQPQFQQQQPQFQQQQQHNLEFPTHYFDHMKNGDILNNS